MNTREKLRILKESERRNAQHITDSLKGQKGKTMLKWRIRESGHGGFMAEYGAQHEGGVEVGFKPGCTMPAFIVYHSSHFDTKKQAEKYIKDNPNPMK